MSSHTSHDSIVGEICEECCKEYTDEWCVPCQINYLKENFINWTSENKTIDNFIQEKQLNIKSSDEIVFEWITYDQFNDIKEININNLATEYLATWEDGPLYYDDEEKEWMRESNEKVTLKCLYNSQNGINEFLDEVKTYSTNNRDDGIKICGISQNTDTKDYVMVFQREYHRNCENCGEEYMDIIYEWCKSCQINDLSNNFTNWTSENEQIDDFIQKMQSSINNYYDKVFEWIPGNQFIDVKEIIKDDFATIYSAIWKDGQLYFDNDEKRLIRKSNKEVTLKCLHGSQNMINEFLNEVKTYSTSIYNNEDVHILEIYGISQNPDTRDYIMVLQDKHCKKCGKRYTADGWCKPCQINYLKDNFTNWTSGNEQVDNLIQEMQLKINHHEDIIFEWIPYDQFNNIKELNKDNFAAIYLARWKDGPLYYSEYYKELMRKPNKKVILKCLYNSENVTDEFLNKVKTYSIDSIDIKIYGVSQNPDTKDYIVILQSGYCEKCGEKNINAMYEKKYQKNINALDEEKFQIINEMYKWCKPCQMNDLKKKFTSWTSENEKINETIREIQLSTNSKHDIIFEWIPYDQFKDVRKIGRGGFAIVYSAIWKDGPITYNIVEKGYERIPDKIVALKCLYNSKSITREFLNEVKAYTTEQHSSNILHTYGISQNPDTKDYIMVLEYADGGNFNDWLSEKYKRFNWSVKLIKLFCIIDGLKEIHQNQMVHCDFHTGNILFSDMKDDCIYISDMGLSGKIGNTDKTKIYGVMPYVAPEVLHGKPYSQAADIYGFGMIMYFAVTGIQPFANCAHDENLAFSIYNGVRPVINEPEAPKCYIDLMIKCWDSNPDKRPNASEIEKSFDLFMYSYFDNEDKKKQHYEMEKQFKAVEEHRQLQIFINRKDRQPITNPQAIYTSRLLNPYTKDLLKSDNKFNDFSDEMAVERMFLSDSKHDNSVFSDGIAVEQLLFQHVSQLD